MKALVIRARNRPTPSSQPPRGFLERSGSRAKESRKTQREASERFWDSQLLASESKRVARLRSLYDSYKRRNV